MARAKAKAKGLLSSPQPLKPYTPTLNGKFIKAGDSQHYQGFPKLRYDSDSKRVLLGFELFFNCDTKLPEIKERDADWVPIVQADYMGLDGMTTLLGDDICNIEEEEYQEACQHALKNPYEARMDGEDDEEGGAPSDDNEGSGSEDSNIDDSKDIDSDYNEDCDGGDNSSDDSDSEGSDNEDYGSRDNSNDRGEPPSDREDEDVGAFYEDNSYDEVDYYDEDIEDYEEAIGGDYDEYPYGPPSDWSCIMGFSP